MYNMAYRLKAVKYYYKYNSYYSAAKKAKCSVGILYKWVNEDCDIKIKKQTILPTKLNEIMLNRIEAYINDNQGICTQREIQLHFSLCKTSVTNAMKKLRMSNKRSSVQMGGKPTEECVKEFCNKMMNRHLDKKQLWSVDECHFSDNIGPLKYYSKIGMKKRLKAKKKIRTRYTLLLGITNDGDFNYDIMEGSCNRLLFTDFVDSIPGDIMCDNAAIHKKSSYG
jgi:hypothetical protein